MLSRLGVAPPVVIGPHCGSPPGGVALLLDSMCVPGSGLLEPIAVSWSRGR